MNPATIATACETLMIICFGLSWPLSVYKSWKSRTSKGKSLQFEIFILLYFRNAKLDKEADARKQ